MVKTKICGLSRTVDITFVNEAGPDYVGFVFADSRRKVTADQARMLKEHLSPAIAAVGVFVNESPKRMVALANERVIDIIQLHGNEDNQLIASLRNETDAAIIQAFSISSKEDLYKVNESDADYFLLDHGRGGTGSAFDWQLLERTVEFQKPFFLAGGMKPENVAYAAEHYHPFGIDISSGVESNGYKDEKKIKEVIGRIRDVER